MPIWDVKKIQTVKHNFDIYEKEIIFIVTVI